MSQRGGFSRGSGAVSRRSGILPLDPTHLKPKRQDAASTLAPPTQKNAPAGEGGGVGRVDRFRSQIFALYGEGLAAEDRVERAGADVVGAESAGADDEFVVGACFELGRDEERHLLRVVTGDLVDAGFHAAGLVDEEHAFVGRGLIKLEAFALEDGVATGRDGGVLLAGALVDDAVDARRAVDGLHLFRHEVALDALTEGQARHGVEVELVSLGIVGVVLIGEEAADAKPQADDAAKVDAAAIEQLQLDDAQQFGDDGADVGLGHRGAELFHVGDQILDLHGAGRRHRSQVAIAGERVGMEGVFQGVGFHV